MSVKTVSILGSTGSVGQSTVDLILSRPDDFSVEVLTCNQNIDLLVQQAEKLGAKRVVVADDSQYGALKERLSHTDIKVSAGRQAVIEAAAVAVDWTMGAIVGMAGLEPLLAAIRRGGVIAIANKEPLVAAGPFVKEEAAKSGAVLLPVDSEHNAVFQVFEEKNRQHIEKIILTASGGPFRTWDIEAMAKATPEQAVNHPNWSMGAKISVDSASMMNKALEIIEAHFLFDIPADQIDVMVHPQSLIHSMVCYRDGSVLAQMGAPDMRTPIAHTLAWPERMNTTGQKLDFSKGLALDLNVPDKEKFPALYLAYQSLNDGLSSCVVFNAANEIAVEAFLDKKIGFLGIVDTVRNILEKQDGNNLFSIEDVIHLDLSIRNLTRDYIDNVAQRNAA